MEKIAITLSLQTLPNACVALVFWSDSSPLSNRLLHIQGLLASPLVNAWIHPSSQSPCRTAVWMKEVTSHCRVLSQEVSRSKCRGCTMVRRVAASQCFLGAERWSKVHSYIRSLIMNRSPTQWSNIVLIHLLILWLYKLTILVICSKLNLHKILTPCVICQLSALTSQCLSTAFYQTSIHWNEWICVSAYLSRYKNGNKSFFLKVNGPEQEILTAVKRLFTDHR